MRAALVCVFVFLALSLQTTLLSSLASFRPDLALPFVLYLALRNRVRSGALLSFLLGYLQDLFIGGTVGLHSFSYILLYLGARPTHDKIKMEGFGPVFFLALFGAFGVSIVDTVLRLLFLKSFPISGEYLGAVALSAVVTAVLSPLIVWIVQWITGAPSGRDEDRLLLR